MIGDPQRLATAVAAVEDATRNVPIPGFGIRKRIAEDVIDALNQYDSQEFLRNNQGMPQIVAEAEANLRARVSAATRADCLAKQHEKIIGSDVETRYVVCQRCEDFLVLLAEGTS
jgi:hypothetical protein